MNECQAERVALIAEGCKVSQHEAETIYEQAQEQAQHLTPNHYEDKIKRIRELDTLQKVKRHHRVSTKSKSAGD